MRFEARLFDQSQRGPIRADHQQRSTPCVGDRRAIRYHDRLDSFFDCASRPGINDVGDPLTRDLDDRTNARAYGEGPISKLYGRQIAVRRIPRSDDQLPATTIRIAYRENAALTKAQQRGSARQVSLEAFTKSIEYGALRDAIEIELHPPSRQAQLSFAQE